MMFNPLAQPRPPVLVVRQAAPVANIPKPTTNTSSNMTVKVKQEKPEDPEITRLANEFKYKNKQKMQEAQLQQNRQQLAGLRPGQQSINTYFGGKKGEDETITEKEEESEALDYKSQLGKFGWTTLGKEQIPFIYRNGTDQYCAVRMVETKLLNKYLQYLPQEVYSCTCIRSYFITEHESKLLNDINVRHCDQQFGKDQFTTKDLVVRKSDAGQFHKFLETCYKKLVLKAIDANDRCGFFRINGDSVVPYTVKDVNGTPVQYVPLFYFEGETDNLKQKAQTVEGWELSYLKFCCKVQGIRNELFASEKCQVVSLEDIKSHFPSQTDFQDWWPQRMPLGGLTGPVAASAGGGTFTQNNMWTQKATTAAPATTTTYRTTYPQTTAAQMTQSAHHNKMHTQTSLSSQQQAAQISAAAAMANRARPPPPLVRANNNSAQQQHILRQMVAGAGQQQQAPAAHSNSHQQLHTQRSATAPHSTLQRSSGPSPKPATQVPTSLGRAPPPLVPVNGSTDSPGEIEEIIDLSSPPASPAAPQRQSSFLDKLIKIPEADNIRQGEAPFKLSVVKIHQKTVSAINAKAYIFCNQELLMKVDDLVDQFFPHLALNSVLQALEALEVAVFKLNSTQMQLMNGRGDSVIPVVLVKNINEFMLQLNYMCSSMAKTAANTEPQQKRQRLL